MQKRSFIYQIGLLSIVITAIGFQFQSCSNSIKEHTSAINPPLEKLIKPFDEYTISCSEEQTITTPNGSTISIPANAFEYTDGKVVEGKITIKYREYHSVADIITSGIPMHYDSAGQRNHFVSAGMFDIKGSDTKGKEIVVKKGKTLLVDMVSNIDGRFNFYDLTEENGKWNYVANDAPKEREEYSKAKAALNLLPEITPVAPRIYDENMLTFDLNVNTAIYPELRAYKGVLWTYYDSINTKENEEIFNKKWKSIAIEKKENVDGVFVIKLDSDMTSEIIEVVPVLKGRDYETAMTQFEQKNKNYHRIKKENQNKEAQIAQIARFTRSFAISGFGIYNWDVFYKNQDALHFTIDFILNNEDESISENAFVYLVSTFENRKSAVAYPNSSRKEFNYIPKHHNQIIALLPDGKIALAKNDVFDKLTYSNLKKGDYAVLTLEMSDMTINSTDDIEKILN